VAPLLIPLDPSYTSVEGFIAPADDRSPDAARYWLRISSIPPGGRSLRGAHLDLGPDLAALMHGHDMLLKSRMKESPGLVSFVLELRSLLSQALASSSSGGSAIPRTADFYSTIKAELECVGWSKVVQLADNMSSLTLRTEDAAGRTHQLTLTFPASFPAAPPATNADLPRQFTPIWRPQTRIRDVLAQFESELERLQRFWDLFDELDASAWVIEPTAPSRSCTYRRVALGSHATLVLKIDPVDPGVLPEIHIMGADRAVDPLLGALRANRGKWQPHCSLKTNLESVLDTTLPSKHADGDAEDASLAGDAGAACAICYNYRRPGGESAAAPEEGHMVVDGGGPGDEDSGTGEVPEVYCDNAACGKPFHKACLREWLTAEPSTRQSLGTLFGACPYCTAPIAVMK